MGESARLRLFDQLGVEVSSVSAILPALIWPTCRFPALGLESRATLQAEASVNVAYAVVDAPDQSVVIAIDNFAFRSDQPTNPENECPWSWDRAPDTTCNLVPAADEAPGYSCAPLPPSGSCDDCGLDCLSDAANASIIENTGNQCVWLPNSVACGPNPNVVDECCYMITTSRAACPD